MTKLALALLASLTACGVSGDDIAGTWAIKSWKVTIVLDQTRTIYDDTLADTGTIDFAGTGEQLESSFLYDALDLVEDRVDHLVPIRRLVRAWWAVGDGALFLAWNYGFGDGAERIDFTTQTDTTLEGESIRQSADFAIFKEETRHYVLERL